MVLNDPGFEGYGSRYFLHFQIGSPAMLVQDFLFKNSFFILDITLIKQKQDFPSLQIIKQGLLQVFILTLFNLLFQDFYIEKTTK